MEVKTVNEMNESKPQEAPKHHYPDDDDAWLQGAYVSISL